MRGSLLQSLLPPSLWAACAIAYPTTLTTVTRSAGSGLWTDTKTVEVLPTGLQPLGDGLADFVSQYAPGLTSVATSAVNNLLGDLDAFIIAYKTANPRPSIYHSLGPLEGDIYSMMSTASSPSATSALYAALYAIDDAEDAWPITEGLLSELQTALSAYPTISAKMMEYESVIQTWEPGVILGEASIVSSDLGVTASPPSWLAGAKSAEPTGLNTLASWVNVSAVTSTREGSTSTSKAGAAKVTGMGMGMRGEKGVVVNAVVAAAGMVAVAVL